MPSSARPAPRLYPASEASRAAQGLADPSCGGTYEVKGGKSTAVGGLFRTYIVPGLLMPL